MLTPRGFYKQEGHENTLERHLSWWPAQAIEAAGKRLGAHTVCTRSQGATVAVLSKKAPARSSPTARSTRR